MEATGKIRASTPMTVAGAITLRRHFEELLLHESGARKGEDPEEIHRMRVASRRMRAALRLFKGYLSPTMASQVNKRLRLLARFLGCVRDLDVYRAAITSYQAEDPPSADHGLDGLLRSCDEAWTSTHVRLVDHLERRGYARLQKSCDHLIISAGNTDTGAPVSEAAPGLVWDRYEKLIDRGTAANDDIDAAAMHRVRIAAKRLRYAIESFDDVFGPGTGPILTELRLAQDHLGALNDALMAVGFTACFLATGSVAGSHAGTVGILAPVVSDYLAHTERQAQHLATAYPSMWDRLSSKNIGADLAVAIGRE